MSYEFKADDVRQFAGASGYKTAEKGNELFFEYCPYCNGGGHDKDTFSVNLETGAFKCFRAGCNKHGHFVELARDFDYQLDFDNTPKTYRRLKQVKIETKNEAIKYLESRGISAETAKRYKITVQKDNPKILVFPFFDENGVMVSAKYRKTDFIKGFDKNKEWFERDTKPILFGMAQCKNFERLIITEGQIDSLTVAECGIDNAVSVPTGANGFTWIQHCYDWVNQFKEIVIFGDCEKNGITLVDGIVSRYPGKVIKVVRAIDYLGEKDANDIYRKYGKDAIIKCIDNAEVQKIKAVKRLSDVKSVDLNTLEHVKTGIYDVDRVIGGLYYGQVILISGKRGEGKSTLASQIIANCLDQDKNVFIYSGELPDYHFKRWLDLQIAGCDNIITRHNNYGDEVYSILPAATERINAWYQDKAYIFDNSVILEETGNGNNALLATIEKSICSYGIKVVLIDNLMTALDVDLSSDLYRAQSDFLKQVKTLAVKYNVAVILIAHPRKGQPGQKINNDSIAGSGDITNRVDTVLIYSVNTGEDKDIHQSTIEIIKNRLTGAKREDDNAIKVAYSLVSKRIVCDNDDPNKVYGCFKNMADTTEICEPPF